jgi:hypothetical protein
MVPALITSIATLLGAVIYAVGQFVSNRNDRTLAQQEVDLLKKLQPGSQAQTDLEMIIRKRIGKWRERYEESHFAFNHARNFLVFAAVAVAMAMPMLFYLKPEEASGGLPDLIRAMFLILIGGAAAGLLGTIVYLILALVRMAKETRERRQAHDADHTTVPDRLPPATGKAGSPRSPPGHLPNGSSDSATVSTSPGGRI